VTVPDFELHGSLRAERLTSHTPSAARVEGFEVTLEREEEQAGLPPRKEPGKPYANVAVHRRVIGRLRGDR
jgi:hypothetical protein